MSTPNAWKLLAPSALAQAKAAGMNLATMTPAEVEQLNAIIGGTQAQSNAAIAKQTAANSTPAAKWLIAAGILADKIYAASKTIPTSWDPQTVSDYCASQGNIPPPFLYPQWDWAPTVFNQGDNLNGEVLGALVNVGENDKAFWWVRYDGVWQWEHNTGPDFDLASRKLAETIAGPLGNWIVDALKPFADLFDLGDSLENFRTNLNNAIASAKAMDSGVQGKGNAPPIVAPDPVVNSNIRMVNDMVAAAKSALPNKPTSTAIVKVPQKVSVITGAMPLMTGAGGAAVGFAMLGPVGALVGGAIGAAVGMAAKSKMTTAKAP